LRLIDRCFAVSESHQHRAALRQN